MTACSSVRAHLPHLSVPDLFAGPGNTQQSGSRREIQRGLWQALHHRLSLSRRADSNNPIAFVTAVRTAVCKSGGVNSRPVRMAPCLCKARPYTRQLAGRAGTAVRYERKLLKAVNNVIRGRDTTALWSFDIRTPMPHIAQVITNHAGPYTCRKWAHVPRGQKLWLYFPAFSSGCRREPLYLADPKCLPLGLCLPPKELTKCILQLQHGGENDCGMSQPAGLRQQ